MVQKKTRRKTRSKTATQKRNTEIIAIVGAVLLLLFSLSIYFQTQTGVIGNTVGQFFYRLFGGAAPWFPPLFFCFLLPVVGSKFHGKLARTVFYLLGLFLCDLLVLGVAQLPGGTLQTALEMGAERGVRRIGGGWLGALLSYSLHRLLGQIGIYVLCAVIVLLFALHLLNISFASFLRHLGFGIETLLKKLRGGLIRVGKNGQTAWKERRERKAESVEQQSVPLKETKPETSETTIFSEKPTVERRSEETEHQSIRINHYAEELSESPSKTTERVRPDEVTDREQSIQASEALDRRTVHQEPKPPTKPVSIDGKQVDFETMGLSVEKEVHPYTPPPVELLKLPSRNAGADENALRKSAKLIEETLLSFGIESSVVSIDRGPTVTCFELKPQSGVKVSRIVNLADDLSLALAAEDIRIEAPIPGKPYVGIEVPNPKKDDVFLREILQTDAFQKDGILPIALGKSISGEPVVASISKMPHLLIAGATGSGKSVCINSIIMSILYRYTPQEVRMILIDPKVVELSVGLMMYSPSMSNDGRGKRITDEKSTAVFDRLLRRAMLIVDLDKEQKESPFGETSIALGNFDGFHNGHRELIRRTIQEEHEFGHLSSVLLFKNHTSDYVPRGGGKRLNSLEDKIAKLDELGISCIYLATFDRAMMHMPHEEFVEEFLLRRLHTRHLVVGEDYSFGRGALGDVDYLLRRREELHYRVSVIPEVTCNGKRISSTRIRQCIAAGGIELANCMLGYAYTIRGRVVSGASRGHDLGFPTANLALQFDYCLPTDGVYLVRATIEATGQQYFGMTNIGTNPTFTDDSTVKIETYLFDFSGDIYDQVLRLEFLRFERRDIKFDTKEELIRRMQEDERVLRSWVSVYETLGE